MDRFTALINTHMVHGVCIQVRVAPQHPASHRVLLPSGALFFLKAVAGKREDDRGTYW